MIATTRLILAIFFFGFGLGLTLAIVFFKAAEHNYKLEIQNYMQESRLHDRNAHGMQYENVADANEIILGYSNGKFTPTQIKTTPKPPPSTTEKDPAEEAALQLEEDIEMSNAVRILCFVLTSPRTHKTKAIHVKRTWGKRCNILLFITTEADPELEPVLIVENIHEDRSYLWAKTKSALKEIYNNYLDEADWFLKADDDTYIVMENLRYMLRNYSSNDSHYFGHTFNPSWLGYEYMSGGAGYILSKRTVIRLAEEAFLINKTSHCRQDHINGSVMSEDLEIGRCLHHLKIPSSDSRDVLGRLRFFPFSPEVHLSHKALNRSEFDWWWKYTKYSHTDGLECCSDTAIAFHYVSPKNMYLYEYFLYHLRPFGIQRRSESAQSVIPTTTPEGFIPSVANSEEIEGADALLWEEEEATTKNVPISSPSLQSSKTNNSNKSTSVNPVPKNITVLTKPAVLVHSTTPKPHLDKEIKINITLSNDVLKSSTTRIPAQPPAVIKTSTPKISNTPTNLNDTVKPSN